MKREQKLVCSNRQTEIEIKAYLSFSDVYMQRYAKVTVTLCVLSNLHIQNSNFICNTGSVMYIIVKFCAFKYTFFCSSFRCKKHEWPWEQYENRSIKVAMAQV